MKKPWKDAKFNMTLEQEKESDDRIWKRRTFKQEEETDY